MRKTIFEKSSSHRSAFDLPDFEEKNSIPKALCRDSLEPIGLPQLSELEVIRHYAALSEMNFSIEKGLYPLGSCTMKYNPKINDEMASLPGFSKLHPYTPPALAQGALELTAELEKWLAELS